MRISTSFIDFYNGLTEPPVPHGITVLNPYQNLEVQQINTTFFEKFYSHPGERKLILGINPGRFGAGITGINFTDPIRLENECGIPNSFPKRGELSSTFIYELIAKLGGVDNFYNQFFLSAICPLGFVQNGKNINYYDDKQLLELVTPYILRTMEQQLALPVSRKVVFCIGMGKNLKFLEQLNQKYGFFKEIVSMPHPRWVMQYRLKMKSEILDEMVDNLTSC